jgi:hypothetical protein
VQAYIWATLLVNSVARSCPPTLRLIPPIQKSERIEIPTAFWRCHPGHAPPAGGHVLPRALACRGCLAGAPWRQVGHGAAGLVLDMRPRME